MVAECSLLEVMVVEREFSADDRHCKTGQRGKQPRVERGLDIRGVFFAEGCSDEADRHDGQHRAHNRGAPEQVLAEGSALPVPQVAEFPFREFVFCHEVTV